MHEVLGPEAGGPRARFSPLRMVARALGAFHGASGAHIGPPPLPAPPLDARRFDPRPELCAADGAGDSFLAIVNAMLADDDTALNRDETTFDLVTLLGGVHDAFAAAAAAKGVSLAIVADPRAAGGYSGGFLQLRQLTMNLLSGALKATDDDVVDLTADWDGTALALRLSDRKAAAVMTRVLTDPARVAPRRGAAQSFAKVQAIAVALGGEVRVLSPDGLEISLPLQRVVDVRQTTPITAPDAAPPIPRFQPGLRMLVAESDPAHGQMLATVLGALGADAVLVSDSQAAVEAWREENWDVLLIDIEGAAVAGRSLIRSIRSVETKARWRRMPLLALAAKARAVELDEDLAAAIDGLVTKPIEAVRLHRAIDTVLRSEDIEPLGKVWAA